MVLDILDKGMLDIRYGYIYYDRKREDIVNFKKHAPRLLVPKRYYPMEACVISDEEKIFISRDAKDKACCLFHECLEILFGDWKDEYFVPKRWGLESGVDPIEYLEAATWDKLTPAQKDLIRRYLPKEP